MLVPSSPRGGRRHPAAPTAEDDPSPVALARLLLVVVVFAALAVLRSVEVGVPLRDPGGEFVRHRVLITLALMVPVVLLDAVRRARAADDRTGVLAALRERWTRRRVLSVVVALTAYHLTYASYHNLKSFNAFNPVQDATLARVDAWLFAGHAPAVLLHEVLGTHAAARVLVVVYESFPSLVALGVVAGLVWPDRLRDGVALVAALVWVWILGVACYYAVPSLGPFHDAPGDFSSLPHTVVTATQAHYLAQRTAFLTDPTAPGAFAQIGAFASLHVGLSAVLCFANLAQGRRRLGAALGLYLALTVLATVYVGWHFAVDDIAGLAIAALAVLLGTTTVRGTRRRARPPTPADEAASDGHVLEHLGDQRRDR